MKATVPSMFRNSPEPVLCVARRAAAPKSAMRSFWPVESTRTLPPNMCAHVDYINTLKTCTTLYHKIGHKSHAYEMLGGGGGGGGPAPPPPPPPPPSPGPGPEFKPTGNFSIWFSICLPPAPPAPPAPPVHPAVIGYLAFAGVLIQGLSSCNSNGPGGTSVPTPLAVRKGACSPGVPSPAPGALLARLTVSA